MTRRWERPPEEQPTPEPAAPEPDESPFPPPGIDKIEEDDRGAGDEPPRVFEIGRSRLR